MTHHSINSTVVHTLNVTSISGTCVHTTDSQMDKFEEVDTKTRHTRTSGKSIHFSVGVGPKQTCPASACYSMRMRMSTPAESLKEAFRCISPHVTNGIFADILTVSPTYIVTCESKFEFRGTYACLELKRTLRPLPTNPFFLGEKSGRS